MPPPEGYGGTEQQNTFPREEQYFMLELEHIQKSFDGEQMLNVEKHIAEPAKVSLNITFPMVYANREIAPIITPSTIMLFHI